MEKDYPTKKLEKYAKGEMQGQELEDFEKQLSNDEGLREEADFYKEVAEAFELKGMIREVDQELAQEQYFDDGLADSTQNASPQKKTTKLQYLFRSPLAYAASLGILIVLTGLGFSNTRYSNSTLSYLTEDQLRLETKPDAFRNRSGLSNADVFADGITALNLNDYLEAERFFSQIIRVDKQTSEAYLYLAFAQFKERKYEAAAKNAQLAIEVGQDPVIRQKAEWLLLNNLLRTDGPSAEFHQLLDKITMDEVHAFKSSALELEGHLNSFWRKLVF